MGYFDDDYNYEEFSNDRRPLSLKVLISIVLISLFVLGILLMVFIANKNSISGKNNLNNTKMLEKESSSPKISAFDIARDYTDSQGNKDIEKLYKDNMLRAEDLDFWDMYDNHEVVYNTPKPLDENGDVLNEDGEIISNEEVPSSAPSPSDNRNISGVEKNNIILSKLKIVNNKMQYSPNGTIISKVGVLLSADNGNVDFKSLKNKGIDFVFLKVGQRGYSTGSINMDTSFLENLSLAQSAGLEIGFYFSSRAITEGEALEEADYCVAMAVGNDIKYPIAYVFEGEMAEESRTDALSSKDITKMAKTFLEEIENQGYIPLIMGTEDFLLNKIEAKDILPDYGVVLDEENKNITYPYAVKMWKYLNNTVIDGVDKPVSYIISFVDYSTR